MKALTEEQQKQLTTTVAMAAGACVLLWLLYQYVLMGMYLDKRDSLTKAADAARQQADKNVSLVEEAKRDAKHWASMNILDTTKEKDAIDRASAEAQSTVYSIAGRAGMTIEEWSQDSATHPSSGHPDFQEVRFEAQARTTTNRIAGFLNELERNLEKSVSLPMRVDQMKIHAKTPGQDDLEVRLTISALVYSPKAAAPATTKPGNQATTKASVASTMAKPGENPAVGTVETESDAAKALEQKLIERRKKDEADAAKAEAERAEFEKLSPEEQLKVVEAKRKAAEIAATQKAAEDEAKQKQLEADLIKRRQQDLGAQSAPGGAK